MKELSPVEVEMLKDAYREVKRPRAYARGEEYKQAVLKFVGVLQGLVDSGVSWSHIGAAMGLSASMLRYYPKVCRERVWSYSRTEEYKAMRNR